jgi:hypothetical protein
MKQLLKAQRAADDDGFLAVTGHPRARRRSQKNAENAFAVNRACRREKRFFSVKINFCT